MKMIPNSDQSLVLRTDFSDEAAWKSLCSLIQEPSGEFKFIAYVDFIDDREYEGLTPEHLLKLVPEDTFHSFVFIVDKVALSDHEHPILVVDLSDQPGRTFRVIPSEAWSIQNNLAIANMGFDEFADNADKDGVFRGFRK
jgi:hypothetical protein